LGRAFTFDQILPRVVDNLETKHVKIVPTEESYVFYIAVNIMMPSITISLNVGGNYAYFCLKFYEFKNDHRLSLAPTLVPRVSMSLRCTYQRAIYFWRWTM